jgi:hypothetical protein
MRGWVDHYISLDMIAADPLLGLKLAKVKSKPHRPWTAVDIKQYEERHPRGTKARLALELLLSTGQARCDVVRMGRQFIHDETLSMSRQKTGVPSTFRFCRLFVRNSISRPIEHDLPGDAAERQKAPGHGRRNRAKAGLMGDAEVRSTYLRMAEGYDSLADGDERLACNVAQTRNGGDSS